MTYRVNANTNALGYRFLNDDNEGLTDNLRCFWPLRSADGPHIDVLGVAPLSGDTAGWATGKLGVGTGKGNGSSTILTTSGRILVEGIASASAQHVDFVVAGWLYADAVGNAEVPIAHYNAVTPERAWVLYTNASNKLQFYVSSNGTTLSNVESTGTMSATTWHFFVIYHDSVADEIGVSLDNSAFDTTSFSGGVWDSDADLSIYAQRSGAGGGTSYFAGRLNDIGYWTMTKPSDAWVDALYNGGNGNTLVSGI